MLHPQFNRRERILLYGAPKSGKALSIDTPIPTPDGFKAMGHIQPGDQVFAMDGSVTKVHWVSPVYHDHDCYRVTFADRTSLVADAEHNWLVRDRQSGTQKVTVKTTVDLTIDAADGDRSNYAVPRLEWPELSERPQWHNIQSIEQVATVPVKCLAVEHDSHTYLAGHHMTVTHNSSCWLSIAQWLEKTNSDAHVHAIDSDQAWEIMSPGNGSLDKRVHVHEVEDWGEWRQAFKSIKSEYVPDRGDWLVIDMIDRMWSASSSGFFEYQFSRDVVDVFMEARKQGASLAGEYGQNWQVINRMYDNLFGEVQKFRGHVLSLAPAAEVRMPDSSGKGGDNKQMLDLYGQVLVKPQGQKMLGYQHHDLLLIQRKPNGDRILTTVGKRARPEEEARKDMVAVPFKDFTVTYLMGTAHWSLGKTEETGG